PWPRRRLALSGPRSAPATDRRAFAKCRVHENDRRFPDRWCAAAPPQPALGPRLARAAGAHESATHQQPRSGLAPPSTYDRFTPRMRRMRPGCFSLPDRTISSWSAAMLGLSTGSPGLSRPDAFAPAGPGAPTCLAASAATAVRLALPL